MKPDWKDAPDFAVALAMDGDGWWIWYGSKPYWDGSEWLMGGLGDWEYASKHSDESGVDWDHPFDTLELRP